MFLLIRAVIIILLMLTGVFKFHYVSINSLLTLVITDCQTYLNSIMFLLIPKVAQIPDSHLMDLNSIMFLLILARLICDNKIPNKFKFHYVSINSRPKTNRLFTPQNLSILSTSSKYIISFSLFIIYFNNTSYFSHFLLLSIPCVFYTITGRQKSLYFYHIKFFISLTLPIMNPINQICNPNIQIHI